MLVVLQADHDGSIIHIFYMYYTTPYTNPESYHLCYYQIRKSSLPVQPEHSYYSNILEVSYVYPMGKTTYGPSSQMFKPFVAFTHKKKQKKNQKKRKKKRQRERFLPHAGRQHN